MIKKKSFQTKLASMFLLIVLLTYSLAGNVLARDNFAFSVATAVSDLNTVQDMNDAANAYANAGYHSYGVTDPTSQELWENLYADVQFFSAHGNVNNVQFTETGIAVGDTRPLDCSGKIKYFIGTNAVHWDADTILVTYSSCNSAGANNNKDPNSIVYKTAERGASVVLGFRDTIEAPSATAWASRYNQKLGEGYGVSDAVNYASSFNYSDPNIKKVQIWHHGDANMKIGRYRSTSSGLGEERNILNRRLSKQTVTTDIESISSAIKEVYPNFDINNYELSYTEGTQSNLVTDLSTTSNTNYIDFNFKIGDFYTGAGYTVEIKNNQVTAIYDNNIDIEKQDTLIYSRAENYDVNLSSESIEELKQDAKQQLLNTSTNNITINDDNITYKYHYNLNTDKKYIVFSIPTSVGSGDMIGLAISNVQIEI